MERIASLTINREITNANQRTLSRMTDLQLQLADGKRIHKPSDDPAGVQQVLRMRASSSAMGDHITTIERTLGLLYTADSAFADMTATLQEIKGLAVQGGTDSNTPEARIAIAAQVDRALEHLVDVGNTTHDGRYVFSGTTTTTRPFALNADRDAVAYLGNHDVVEVDISPVSRMQTTQDGSAVLQQPTDVFDVLVRLRDALRADDGPAVRALIGDVDVAHQQVTDAYGDLGGREVRLETTQNQLMQARVILDEQVSLLEDADLAEVISRFTQAEVALQAGLQSGARVMQTSLLDFLT